MKCETLEVWKRSCRLTSEIYKFFSKCNNYGFKDQITRSSLSIPSNIAEGFEREGVKDIRRFLNYSISSCAELITQIYIGIDIGYIDKTNGFKWVNELNELIKMIKQLSKNL
jgi:four helix bundle protein